MINLVLMHLVFTGCEQEEQAETCNPKGERGELVDAAFLLSFTPEQIQPYLSMFGAPASFVPTHATEAYRIHYMTPNKNNELVKASGVLFIPQGVEEIDLVSVQHGSALKRTNTGSVNPVYAIDGILFSMSGYMAAAPDYLGLGVSEEMHPYLHAELTASAVVDMLRAARIYACENDLMLSDQLFLAGYSEGGYATLATQMIMEEEHTDEFQLAGVAPMSGPYDLLGSTRSFLQRESYDIPAFLSYVVVAYDDVYAWGRLDEVFNSPYAGMMPGLFDGSQSLGDVNDQLPKTINELFKSSFIDGFLTGGEPDIQQALEENTLLGWGPVAPVRFYHGTADSTVPIENTYTAYESLRDNGGVSVDMVTLLGADHVGGFLPSMILAETWFDSLRAANR